MIQIAHIINPVKVSQKSDLYIAQPITFESMRRAKYFSIHSEKISLYTTQFEEDEAMIPEYFIKLPNLERSVLDVNTTLNGKKLPLITDILNTLKENTTDDYLIYTNVDIGLMPQFYDRVFSLIENGHDAIVINRRRLNSTYQSVDDLPKIYSDLGCSHPGFDCFVIKQELMDQFILNTICIGISFLEVTLIHNIIAFANNPKFVLDEHITFHIGMDVLVPRNNAYYLHNRSEYFANIEPLLKPHFDLKKFPYGTLPWPNRMLKWGLNPSVFTRNYIHLEGKSIRKRLKGRLDEIRWRFLQR